MGQSLIVKTVDFGYELLIKIGTALQALFLLIFRLYWGWHFFATGKGKLIGHDHTVEFFTKLNIPAPNFNAWFVGGVECFGGLFLLVGLCARPVAFMLTINMLVAYLSVADDRSALFGIFQDPEPFLDAEPFFFLLTAVIVFVFGPGLISVDALLKRYVFKRK